MRSLARVGSRGTRLRRLILDRMVLAARLAATRPDIDPPPEFGTLPSTSMLRSFSRAGTFDGEFRDMSDDAGTGRIPVRKTEERSGGWPRSG